MNDNNNYYYYINTVIIIFQWVANWKFSINICIYSMLDKSSCEIEYILYMTCKINLVID